MLGVSEGEHGRGKKRAWNGGGGCGGEGVRWATEYSQVKESDREEAKKNK